jgi:chromosome segregation ATPase
MSTKYYVETLPSGKQQFVALKRSHSHHHHDRHHNHHRRHELANVTQDEWDNLVERERNLREANDQLGRENLILKTNFQNADAEVRRLNNWIPHLQSQVNNLVAENQSLRRSIDSASDHSVEHHRQVEKLKSKNAKLKDENETLRERIRDLTRRGTEFASDKIAELTEAVNAWRHNFNALEDRYLRLRTQNEEQAALINSQHEKITVYTRILRRHGLLN